MTGKKRRKYSSEFKEEAVNLVTEQGYGMAEAALNLGIAPSLLSRWKQSWQEEQDSPGDTSPASLREEIQRLKRENKRLTMEREILKKATAFFAKEQK